MARYYRKPTPVREIDSDEWTREIFRQYGVQLGPNQVYADRRGYVMAASEYVATLGVTDSPKDATEWAESISHFPRGTHRLDTNFRL